MRTLLLATLIISATCCAAHDYGDAPASYGLPYTGGTQTCRLGATNTADTQNPVTPAWTGDVDDGIVGALPVWDSWSFNNSLTVRLENGGAYLLMWVDANDNGTFEDAERYEVNPGYVLPDNADYTFTGIKIHATQDFNHNAHNKVAVRIWAQDTIGGPPQRNPGGHVYIGEIEDWLIDVEPAKFVVATEYLREATEGDPYSIGLTQANGSGPFTWSLLSGQLPTGMTLVQQGDMFVLAGTPQAGSAGTYPFTVEVADSAGTAQRTLELEVTPEPFALPFVDSFSTNNHWKLGQDWAIAATTGFVGTGVSGLGYPAAEPAHDYTPGNSDDQVLMTTPGAEEPVARMAPTYAMSPKIDCSGINDVQLRFRRFYSGYLGMDKLRIQITTDGANWDEVWTPPYTQGGVCDIEWSLIQVDISQWAANKPWVRFRVTIGPFVHYYASSQGFCGWVIDDFEVRETPISSPITAHDFELSSAGTWVNPVDNNSYPIAYPQHVHSWSVKVDNPTAQAITIDSIECAVLLDTPAGSGNWWDGPPYYCSADCWYDMGPWVLSQPVTVSAGATDVVVSGTYDFAGSLAQYWLVVFKADIYLRGMQGSEPLEITAQEKFVPNYQPMPGLYVWESASGTTPIQNGAAPAGLRDFGSIATGGNSGWLNIVLENTMSSDLTIGTPTLSGPDAAEFALWTQSITNPISGGSTTYFAVMFLPTSVGVKTATVEFTHNAGNTSSPFTFDVSGLGSANSPILSVHETGPSGAQIGYNSPPAGGRQFGQQDINAGQTSALTIYIENAGTVNLVLGMPTLTGNNASAFVLNTTGFQTTLVAGASTTFTVAFDPTTTGIQSAMVEFTHNDPGTTSAFVFGLEGEGIIAAPLIAVSEGAAYGNTIQPGDAPAQGRQFGTQDVAAGRTTWVRIFVRNDGWNGLALGTPTLGGSNPGDFVLDTAALPGVLAGLSITWFDVAFDPTAKGLKQATVSFSHDDTTVANPFTFEVEGYASDPSGVTITTPALPPAQLNEPYSAQLGATLGTAPYTWALHSGSLPAGLTMDAAGVVSGIPTGSHGVTQFDVEVTDTAGGTEVRTIQLIVQPPVGFIGKEQGTAGGGCSADSHGGYWMGMLLMLLAAGAFLRRRA
ncbi:MAG: choice-of-anchor D domain-containing protein [Planctomycetes bacterium]|nr:choice-of-anchor D domain-containing protein [Planctomycetota bacterium]